MLDIEYATALYNRKISLYDSIVAALTDGRVAGSYQVVFPSPTVLIN